MAAVHLRYGTWGEIGGYVSDAARVVPRVVHVTCRHVTLARLRSTNACYKRHKTLAGLPSTSTSAGTTRDVCDSNL